LKQRSSVDFPQPDGPMIAVTACCGIANETFLTAATSPKKAERFSATMHGAARSEATVGSGARTCTVGVASRAGFSGNTSVDWSTET